MHARGPFPPCFWTLPCRVGPAESFRRRCSFTKGGCHVPRGSKGRRRGGWDASVYRSMISDAIRSALSRSGLRIAAQDREDLVQDALLRAWKLVRPSTVTSPKGLLHRIARSVVSDWARHLRACRRIPLGMSIDSESVCERIAAPGAGPFERAVAKEEFAVRLDAARKLLPLRHYWVYVLRRVRCMNAEQTGAALGVSAAAVNSIMYRVNQRLKGLDMKP